MLGPAGVLSTPLGAVEAGAVSAAALPLEEQQAAASLGERQCPGQDELLGEKEHAHPIPGGREGSTFLILGPPQCCCTLWAQPWQGEVAGRPGGVRQAGAGLPRGAGAPLPEEAVTAGVRSCSYPWP